MAKFELEVYDMATETVVKTLQRNMIPVDLYIRYQELSEKITSDKVTSDSELFKMLKGIFLETFPALTEKEYMTSLDVAQVLNMFKDIINKSSQFESGNSKNA